MRTRRGGSRPERRARRVAARRTGRCRAARARSSTSSGSTSRRGVAHDLRYRAGASRDDRYPRRHGLERRKAETFVARRIREHRRAGEEVAAYAARDVAERTDALAVVGSATGLVEGLGAPAVGSGHDQHEIALVLGDRIEGPHEHRQVLAGLDGPDREHVTLGPRRAAAQRGVATVRGRHPRIDAYDPFGGYGERRGHLGGDEVAGGVDPRAAGDRPAQQRRILRARRGCTVRGIVRSRGRTPTRRHGHALVDRRSWWHGRRRPDRSSARSVDDPPGATRAVRTVRGSAWSRRGRRRGSLTRARGVRATSSTYATSSVSSRRANSPTRPLTTSPIPVRGPSSGVPSSARRIMGARRSDLERLVLDRLDEEAEALGRLLTDPGEQEDRHDQCGREATGEEAELDAQEQVVARRRPSRPRRSTRPTVHAMSARPCPSSAISACASVSARMNAALPMNSSVRSWLLRLNLSPKRIWPTVGPMVAPATMPRSADADDDHDQLLQPGAEVVVLPRPRQGRELREQRGLHGLEQQDRDAGDEEPDDEVGGFPALVLALREHDRAERSGVAEGLRGERPEEEQREVGRELRPFGVGPRLEQTVLAPQRDDAGDERWDRERESVPEQVVDPERVRARSPAGSGRRPRRRGSSRRARSGRCPTACPA